MSDFGLLLLGSLDGWLEPPEWVIDFDPDGGDQEIDYPTGLVITSDHAEDAKRFATFVEASEFWRQESKRTPLRPDGKPNRPLTAYTIEITPLPD